MSKSDKLRYGAPGKDTVHLCVDMQRMFAESCPIESVHPEQTLFTRFIPAAKPGHGVGMWRHRPGSRLTMPSSRRSTAN